MTHAVEESRTTQLRDVAVVGAGPAGLAAALALAHVGADVALIGPAPPKASAASGETRTAALLASSVDLLKALHVWPALAPHAAPLEAIRIIDASRSLLRAPDIEFKASELGLDGVRLQHRQHHSGRDALCAGARDLACGHRRRASRRLPSTGPRLSLRSAKGRSLPRVWWPAPTAGGRSAAPAPVSA